MRTAVVLNLLIVHCLTAQEATFVDIRTRDGSQIRAAVLDREVEIATRYGVLKLPVADIREIVFGHRVPDDVAGRLKANLELLTSADFRLRDRAGKELIRDGRWSYAALRQYRDKIQEPEGQIRSRSILAQIEQNVPADVLAAPMEDRIQIGDMTIVGRLAVTKLRLRVSWADKMEVVLTNLESCKTRQAAGTFTVQASAADWYRTGLMVDGSIKIFAKASGSVDIYPPQPGQYIVNPTGFSANGHDTAMPAGALIARIGYSGQPFVLGENYQGLSRETGELQLSIVRSAWENGSTGQHRVDIRLQPVE